MDEKQLRLAIDDIAGHLLRWVDPSENYLIIRRDKAGPFITARLTSGQPVNMVGHRDSPSGNPIRDCGIYHVTNEGEGHNEISAGWVEYLVENGIADLKVGKDVTVEDLKACAVMTGIAFLEASNGSDDS